MNNRQSLDQIVKQGGLTLVELLVVIAISGLLLVPLTQVVSGALLSREINEANHDLNQQANFAMQKMVSAIANSHKILIPQQAQVTRNVLALTQSPKVDLDKNGVFDADNDANGHFDDEPSKDTSNDGAAGIIGIDDDGDGNVDEGNINDDDEDGSNREDEINGLDDDGDGLIDEDPHKVGDGNDWYDPVVFYLQGDELIGRIPVPWDQNNDSEINGRDYIESVLANKVTTLSIVRLAPDDRRWQLVEISLQLTNENNESISLMTKVRLGAQL